MQPAPTARRGASRISARWDTRLWHDARELPEAIDATLSASDGFSDVADLLSHKSVRRVVITGNGASYYVALNMWLASLDRANAHPHAEVLAIPAGLIATGHFQWQDGDALLAISSSGEFRDLVDAILDVSRSIPCAAITADPDSTIGTHATARALVAVISQRAITHTQAYCGALAASLAVWARVTHDDGLERLLHQAAGECARSLQRAETWVAERIDGIGVPAAGLAFGSGPALSAALEAALLMKEVARLPWEGSETREGATSGMFSLGPGQLVVVIGPANDPLLHEAGVTCAATGATVVSLPGAEGDGRLAAITSFPAALAAALSIAHRQGRDVDQPDWAAGYYATARSTDVSASRPGGRGLADGAQRYGQDDHEEGQE
jgi:fructoselysine-6-P-deglycase FrlB-like protein